MTIYVYKLTSAYVNLPVDVEVGLLPLNRSVTENETFPVCVEITAGTLGCNITVPLEVQEGSALGKEIVKIFRHLSMTSKLLIQDYCILDSIDGWGNCIL